MKICGIACILVGALWGTRVSIGERRRRRGLLADLRAALARMGDEIRLARVPLPDLLERVAETCGADAAGFFRAVSAGIRRGLGPSGTWTEAADTLPLSDTDRATLREFASVLRGDEEQIRTAAALLSGRLERSLRDMDDAAPADLRRSAALMFSAAALLVILLY
ncbi:MAG: stage III sporulation protein AB [Oscillibacter sp.]|nr:stage III sporulation protein AB [Oscillibacter sp.]